MTEITAVYVWHVGDDASEAMVMVFDRTGQQVPEYQGQLSEVGERLAAVFPRERWIHGRWNETHRARST